MLDPSLPVDPNPSLVPAAPTTPMAAMMQPPARPAEQDRKDAGILEKMRDRWRARRADFIKTYDKVEEFSYGKSYDKLLYDNNESTQNMSIKAKINRAAEFAEIMGSYIFPNVPDAQVTSRPWATYWQRKRHMVEQNYLQYALWEGDFHQHMRKEITEALLSGRSCLFTGLNDRKGIFQNVYRSCRDFLIDSDAKCSEEANGIAILRSKPKWKLKQEITAIRGDDSMDSVIDGLSVIKDGDPSGTENADDRETAYYYEFYLRVGLWRFGDTTLGGETAEDGSITQDDSPKKFYWVPGHVLAVTEWELPLFMIDEWPLSWLDLRPKPNSLWPASPLETGLTHLEQLNYMYSFYTNRIRFAWRTFLIAVNYNGTGVSDDELLKLVFAGDFSFLRVKVSGNEIPFDKLVQQFKMDSGIDEFERAWALVSSEFAKSTGLSEIMYSGEGQRQSRVSADVEFKAKTSQSRVEDMRQLTIEHESRVMRKTIMAARFLQSPEEIAKILGAEAGTIWGRLGSPEQVAAEQQQRQMAKQKMMQQAQAMQMQYQKMMQQMPPPMPGGPMAPPPPIMPTEDDMERDLGPPQLVDLESWIHEADRTIDAGTAKAQDHDTKVDTLQMIIGQYGPVITALPGGARAISTALLELSKLVQLSHDMQSCLSDMVKDTTGIPPAGMAPSAPSNPMPNGAPPTAPAGSPA